MSITIWVVVIEVKPVYWYPLCMKQCLCVIELQSSFYDKTEYTIMFGPDKCGNDHKVVCLALYALVFACCLRIIVTALICVHILFQTQCIFPVTMQSHDVF